MTKHDTAAYNKTMDKGRPSRSRERARAINAMYKHGRANSQTILTADFGGDWPPRGLDISTAPDTNVFFWHFIDNPAECGYVLNTERENRIYINRLYDLVLAFNAAAACTADTISHENIHILQKSMIWRGISDCFGQYARHGIRQMLRSGLGPLSAYDAAEDEIQARMHEIVAHHYRERGTIPLNRDEILALLEAEGVDIHPDCTRFLLADPDGCEAMIKFHPPSYRKGIFKPDPVRHINRAIAAIAPDHRYRFSADILPGIYGNLLELYGDREGSRRIGHARNVILDDLFFLQANATRMDTTKMAHIIAAMPPAQAADLCLDLPRMAAGEGRRKISRVAAAQSIRMIVDIHGRRDICGVEEIGLIPYTDHYDTPADLSGLHPQ